MVEGDIGLVGPADLGNTQHLAYPEIFLSVNEDSLVWCYTFVGALRHGSG
jgi:hypothetical protein